MQDENIYVKTYFRVDTPSYDFPNGYDEANSKSNFNEEVKELFSKIGFEIDEPKFSGSCQRGYRNVESLYFHPQHFSGYVNKTSISEIENVIRQAESFKLRFTDTYEEVLNYTKEEFLQELNNRRNIMIKSILERFKTKRRNLYISEEEKYNIKSGISYFKSSVVGGSPLERAEREFKEDLFNNLLAEGKLIQAETKLGISYRAITDKDIKEKKKQTA